MARALSVPLSLSAFPSRSFHHRLRLRPFSPRCCSSLCASPSQHVLDIAKYREAFSQRMAMAGLNPRHRIALGVSGGPDSMALCVLTAHWKTSGLDDARDSDGFIDGMLAIVVDHSLRAESKEEADTVSSRVSGMGVRCEIARCEWLDGRPKQGHLQLAARGMRYQQFQKVCMENQIGVLLIAHHADDQAELFVIRLSRNSGVLGLAGMPFMSQIFSEHSDIHGSKSHGSLLVVRPLLNFSKEDMYKICRGGEQNWVEDPTNQSMLYTRNRIRTSLTGFSSKRLDSELQSVISACRQTRLYVDSTCFNLISKAVSVMDLGYAVIDLKIINQSKTEDIVLSRFITWILQFISQRNRPVRGSASKLLLNFLKKFPCKTSVTAAGCYLCPAPASKGTKALVCYSVNHPLPQTTEFQSCLNRSLETSNNIIEQIVESSKLNWGETVPHSSQVHFLDTSSVSVLSKAKRLGILSDETYEKILEVQNEEVEEFRGKSKVIPESESKQNVQFISAYSEPIRHGEVCLFMNRFSVTWKVNEEIGNEHERCCTSCLVSDDMAVEVRHMTGSDWLYLATLVKNPTSEHAKCSAERAIGILKSVPVAARRGLPILHNGEGLLLSIPNIGFKICPRLDVTSEFRPRVPVGGGFTSFV